MADVKWIKVTTDIFDDEKILLIESLPEADSIIVLWLKLLSRARRRNNKGLREFRIPGVDLTDEVIGTVFRYKGSSVGDALQALADNGLIARHRKCIEILPFWADKRDRNSPVYKAWRNAVFKRDGFTCQKCGTKKDIEAHHIISWADTNDRKYLRYCPENGVTLCRRCHLEAHGGRWKNG